MAEHFDVVIVGAGLSGIGAGYHLQTRRPGKTYAILEGREAIGGTWDLFRYPGVRSDSDMFTLGYSFRPWTQAKAIADGPSILAYIRETAREYGIDQRIQFNTKVTRADWSSTDARWTVETIQNGAARAFTCGFLFMCSGYYRYDQGYTPAFPGLDQFDGRVAHPQFWSDDIAYAGKRVVVIGSGATAVTLVPALAKAAAHVTMLQRSPTYVVSRPSQDAFADRWRRRLPAKLAHGLVRWRNVLWGMYIFRTARRRPAAFKAFLLGLVRKHLGPDYDVATHFTPRYNPWDQRLCLVPDGDLFEAIKSGAASVVTDEIVRFTPHGITLRSGAELPADLVVTATGLDLVPVGGVALSVDGVGVEPGEALTYKGMMYSDVPNMAVSFGYTNASWTLKSDLTAAYVCRMLNYMDAQGFAQCTPRRRAGEAQEPFVDFSSGYFTRARDRLPKQGARPPWRLHQNYARDVLALRYGALTDEAMEFTRAAPVRETIDAA